MAGGINDVDPGAFPLDAGTFGQDRDAALTLDVIAVHRTLLGRFVFTIDAGLLEKFVNECRFAVVNVCDDRNIADIHGISL